MVTSEQYKKRIARLQTRLEFWKNKLDNTWTGKRPAIQRKINEIRTEIEIESSLLFRAREREEDSA